MTTITQLRLWRDPGYTEGCLEVPSFSDTLPTADVELSMLNPAKDKLFSEVRVPLAYEDIYDMCYLEAVFDMNNGDNVTFYGWVDSVTCSSDTAGYPISVIRWHIDEWRTFASKAQYGSGMVKRRPLLTNDSVPPQSYPCRYKLLSSNFTFLTIGTYYWVIAVLSSDKFVGKPTITIAFPVSASQPNTNLDISFPTGTSYKAPSFNDLVSGHWDEYLGLNPDSVYSVFLSPIAPNEDMTKWGGYPNRVNEVDYGAYMALWLDCITEYSGRLPSTITPDDVNNYVVLGFDGEIIGALPWGIPVSTFKYRLIIDTTSAYIQLRFDNIKSHSEGLCFTIPLIPISLTSNAWSSYVYSGARQADIMQARAEADKTREAAIVSMTSNVTSSIASSALLGSLGGPVGALGGAAIGGAATAILGTIGAVADYAVNTKYNDVFQNITDYRMAHQPNGLLMSGTGFDSVRFGRGNIMLGKLSMDDYSQEQRAKDITQYGVHVSEPVSSCQSLIQTGGPLQIDNLVVTGSIPAHAKAYLRERFAKGVRII